MTPLEALSKIAELKKTFERGDEHAGKK
jgi:hypothetical protein